MQIKRDFISVNVEKYTFVSIAIDSKWFKFTLIYDKIPESPATFIYPDLLMSFKINTDFEIILDMFM